MHQFNVRVYYEDTDAAGIVYYANYLRFAERARTEALRNLGLEQSALKDAYGIAFVVRRAEVDFLLPATLDDLLTIETRLVDIKGARLHMRQRIFRKCEALVELGVELAVIGSKMTPVRLPPHLRQLLSTLLAPS